MGDILIGLTSSINAVLIWFNALMLRFSAWPLVFAAIVSMLIVRFIVYPFLKSGVGSDSVKESYRKGYDSGYSKGKNDWSVK